jgi:YVTN family beta-propeller protein
MRRDERGTVLVTLLFTDVVGSTELADRLGGRRWRELVTRHHAVVRRELKRFGGKEIDTAGDGFFAIFPKPAEAIRCAVAISDSVRALGIEIRAGLHIGEVEVSGIKPTGIAVHLGARTMAAAQTGEVVVTSLVRDLVPGSGLEFEDMGSHQLKGIPGERQLFRVSVIDGQARPSQLDPATADERLAAIQPPLVSRRLRRPLFAAAAVVLVVSLIAGLLAVRSGHPDRAGGSSPSPSVTSTEQPAALLIQIDADTRTVTEFMPLPGSAAGVVFAAGSVWVIDQDENLVLRIDPARRMIDARIAVGNTPSAIAADEKAIWVANPLSNSVSRIDPSTNEVTATISIAYGPKSIAAGEGAVWVSSSEGPIIDALPTAHVSRIDPVTSRVVEDRQINSICVPRLAAGAGYGWAVTPFGAVWRFDPLGGEPKDVVDIHHPLAGVDAESGTVWIATEGTPGEVRGLDPATGELGPPISVGSTSDPGRPGCQPVHLVVGSGRLWVTNRDDRSLSVVATLSNQVIEAIHLEGTPTGMAFGLGALWVTLDTR